MKKDFKPTEAQILAASKVFAAMAWVDTIRPEIEQAQTELLQRKHFVPCSKQWEKWERDPTYPQRITHWKHVYMVSEQDAGWLYTEIHNKYLQMGYTVEFGYCPLLIAESKLRDARRELVDVMEPVTGLSFDRVLCSANGLENLDKLVELTLRLLAPYVHENLYA